MNDPDSPTLADAVVGCLTKSGDALDLDAVILSGDFMSNDQAKDVHPAKDMMAELLEKLKISRDRVVCVPGNHDLTWDASYKKVFLRFYKEAILGLNGTTLPDVVLAPPRNDGSRPLALILLDSCRLESKEMSGIGRIGESQLKDVERKLRNKKVTAATHNLLAVLHHHLLPISPEVKIWNAADPHGPPVAGVSHTVDAVEVLRRLAEAGVTMVLHGHQHRAAVLQHRHLWWKAGSLYVIAAGSCGASQTKTKEAFLRQFFLYEIDDLRARVTSYWQSKDNDDQFQQGEAVEVPMRSAGKPARGEIQELAQAKLVEARVVEKGRATESDLRVLLLSVFNSPHAREIIRDFAVNFPTSAEWSRLKPKHFRLVALYDLMGHWDLAVKFRLDPAVDASEVAALIEAKLVRAKMMPRAKERPKTTFNFFDLIAIERELPVLDDIKNARGEVAIPRVWLRNTDAYERYRCQRGLIYIDAKTRRGELLESLRAALAADPQSRQVVECVCVSRRAILLEVFMGPDQLSSMNRLNRTIENALSRYKSQKFSSPFYGYDEESLP